MARSKKKETDEAEVLETAFGLSFKDVTVKRKTLRVSEFTFAQLPLIIRLIRSIKPEKGASTIDTLIDQSSDLGIELAILSTGKSREFFEEMGIGDAMGLFSALIEVNASFFVHLPDLQGLAVTLKEMIGSSSLLSSSEPGIQLKM